MHEMVSTCQPTLALFDGSMYLNQPTCGCYVGWLDGVTGLLLCLLAENPVFIVHSLRNR